MNTKIMLKLVFFMAILTLVTACNKETTNEITDDTRITSFKIFNDSIKTLNQISLTVDNTNNLIYSADSLPYGTPLDSIYTSIYGPNISSIVINDSIIYSDTIAIDFNKPVKVRSFAKNIAFYRDYTVTVDVHQVDPELFIWKGILTALPNTPLSKAKALYLNETLYYYSNTATTVELATSTNGSNWTTHTTNLPAQTELSAIVNYGNHLAVVYNDTLYTTTDGMDWTKQSTTGETPKTLLFTLNGVLYALSDQTALAKLIYLSDELVWTTESIIPTGFPVEGAACCIAPGPTGVYRVYLAGGADANGTLLNSIWSSEDGHYWTNFGNNGKNFSSRTQAALIQYSDGLMLFGGRDESGTIEPTISYSPDYGLTWYPADDKMQINPLYVPRYNISAIITADKRIMLIGGQTNTAILNDVWSGFQYAELPGFRK